MEVTDSIGLPYSPETCTTAGELRNMGIIVSESIPDCAWVPKWSWIPGDCKASLGDQECEIKFQFQFRYTEPFRWLEGTFVIEEENNENRD